MKLYWFFLLLSFQLFSAAPIPASPAVVAGAVGTAAQRAALHSSAALAAGLKAATRVQTAITEVVKQVNAKIEQLGTTVKNSPTGQQAQEVLTSIKARLTEIATSSMEKLGGIKDSLVTKARNGAGATKDIARNLIEIIEARAMVHVRTGLSNAKNDFEKRLLFGNKLALVGFAKGKWKRIVGDDWGRLSSCLDAKVGAITTSDIETFKALLVKVEHPKLKEFPEFKPVGEQGETALSIKHQEAFVKFRDSIMKEVGKSEIDGIHPKPYGPEPAKITDRIREVSDNLLQNLKNLIQRKGQNNPTDPATTVPKAEEVVGQGGKGVTPATAVSTKVQGVVQFAKAKLDTLWTRVKNSRLGVKLKSVFDTIQGWFSKIGKGSDVSPQDTQAAQIALKNLEKEQKLSTAIDNFKAAVSQCREALVEVQRQIDQLVNPPKSLLRWKRLFELFVRGLSKLEKWADTKAPQKQVSMSPLEDTARQRGDSIGAVATNGKDEAVRGATTSGHAAGGQAGSHSNDATEDDLLRMVGGTDAA